MRSQRSIFFAVALFLSPLCAVARDGLVRGDPAQLILQEADLPFPFELSSGDRQPGGGYAAVYFRPAVLMAESLPAGGLLGVMASFELTADAAAADVLFRQADDAESIRSPMESPEAGAELDEVRQLEARLEGADEALLFRVEYRLQGVHLVEYRYRFRIANAVVSLMVSGRAGGGGLEPSELAAQARTMAERQLARLDAGRH